MYVLSCVFSLDIKGGLEVNGINLIRECILEIFWKFARIEIERGANALSQGGGFSR